MLDDAEPPFGCEDDAIRAERAMCGSRAGRMQRRKRRCDLANDPGDDSGVQPFAEPAGRELRQPLPRQVPRDQRQVVLVEVDDGSHLGKRGVSEAGEAFNPFTQRIVETRGDSELAPEAKQLQRDRVSVIKHQQAIAERVASPRGVPTGEPRARQINGRCARAVHRHETWRASGRRRPRR